MGQAFIMAQTQNCQISLSSSNAVVGASGRSPLRVVLHTRYLEWELILELLEMSVRIRCCRVGTITKIVPTNVCATYSRAVLG